MQGHSTGSPPLAPGAGGGPPDLQDGYPRTLEQAQALEKHQVGRSQHNVNPPTLTLPPPHPAAHTPWTRTQRVTVALNITLPERVLLAKMLARRTCADCGKGYNLANIKEGDLDMPPLLPKPSDCDRCHGKPRLVVRDDDKEDIVKARFGVYHTSTAPLIDFYTRAGLLQTFDVKKGLDDTPRLFKELGI
jgi:adenylate kinase family enzyme